MTSCSSCAKSSRKHLFALLGGAGKAGIDDSLGDGLPDAVGGQAIDVFGPPYGADLFRETEARTDLLQTAEAFLRGLDGGHQLEERAIHGAEASVDEKALADHHEAKGEDFRRLYGPQYLTDVQVIIVVHKPPRGRPTNVRRYSGRPKRPTGTAAPL